MANRNPEEASKRISHLRENYKATLPEKLARLQEVGRLVTSATAWETVQPLLQELKAATHMMAGSAPTFGFEEVGGLARTAEHLATQMLDGGTMPAKTEIAELEGVLAVMAGATIDAPSPVLVKRMAIIGGRAGLTPAVARELERHGYAVTLVHDAMGALALPATLPLTAILVETDSTNAGHMEWLARLSARRRTEAPVIFFGESGDFGARYAAAAAGALDYLPAPLAIADLPDRIEKSITGAQNRPYRILCVGEGLPLLDGSGLLVRTITDPTELIVEIENFQPEIIIFSPVDEPYNPVHLARVVWQHQNYSHISIFFAFASQSAPQTLLANGITDAYCFPGPLDPITMRNRIVRHAYECRASLRPPNSQDFAEHLIRMGSLNLGSTANADIVGTRLLSPTGSLIERSQPKILIVDDDRYLVSFLANALSTHGMDVLRAYSGDQGYAVAWQQMPNFILSDVEMPNGRGDQMILQLRSNPRTRTIPVIIMTGRRWEGGRDYALERELRGRLGASSYLQKPVEVDEIVKELARL